MIKLAVTVAFVLTAQLCPNLLATNADLWIALIWCHSTIFTTLIITIIMKFFEC